MAVCSWSFLMGAGKLFISQEHKTTAFLGYIGSVWANNNILEKLVQNKGANKVVLSERKKQIFYFTQ